jgi:hypothetical protein
MLLSFRKLLTRPSSSQAARQLNVNRYRSRKLNLRRWTHATPPGLPDGFFSNQKSQFG